MPVSAVTSGRRMRGITIVVSIIPGNETNSWIKLEYSRRSAIPPFAGLRGESPQKVPAA